jgi:hypothetical protein
MHKQIIVNKLSSTQKRIKMNKNDITLGIKKNKNVKVFLKPQTTNNSVMNNNDNT